MKHYSIWTMDLEGQPLQIDDGPSHCTDCDECFCNTAIANGMPVDVTRTTTGQREQAASLEIEVDGDQAYCADCLIARNAESAEALHLLRMWAADGKGSVLFDSFGVVIAGPELAARVVQHDGRLALDDVKQALEALS